MNVAQNKLTDKQKAVWDEWSSKRLAVFGQVALLTVTTMAVTGGGGYLLDMWLGTSPLLFILGLAVGFPAAQISIYRKFKK